MRIVLSSFAFAILASLIVAKADDATPAEQKTLNAIALLKGVALLKSDLHSSARVAVRFESATDATLLALAKHPSIGSIQIADAKSCTIKGLNALQMLPHLRRLVLNSSNVNDAQLASIAANKQLRALILPESNLTDAGIPTLVKLTRLEELDLSENPKLTDKGLSQLKKLERLEILILNKTALTDKGLLELSSLDGLRSLNVGGTKVTDEAADKFPENMPNLRTVRR